MLIAIVLLAILFIVGINSLLYKNLDQFFWWIRFFFPNASSVAPTMALKEKKSANTNTKAELEGVFATFDKNGDGFITKQELGESLKNMGFFSTEKEVGSMVERLDSNGDGLIDSYEFFELYETMGRQDVRTKDGEEDIEEEVDLREAFGVFDKDGDELITVEELVSVLSSLGLEQGLRIEDGKEMIKNVDLDGDGMVSFDEFKQMMKTGGQASSSLINNFLLQHSQDDSSPR